MDILLVDGKNALWRAADAHQELGIEENGSFQRTGAIYGFLSIVTRVYQQLGGMVVVCWDDWTHGPAERLAIYPDYKRRPENHKGNPNTPEKADLLRSFRRQQDRLMGLLSIAGVRQAWSPRWEADDVMGTLARKLGSGRQVAIYSGDRDMYQCLADGVVVVRPQKRGELKTETAETVAAEWNVTPAKWVDFKALAGDAGDNIPGCPGIGPKKAATILAAFDSVSLCLDSLAFWSQSGLPEKLREALEEHQDQIRLSYRLAKLNLEAPVKFLPRCPDQRRLVDEFVRLRFKSLLTGNRYCDLLQMGAGQ
jgi:DNA polymerase-1